MKTLLIKLSVALCIVSFLASCNSAKLKVKEIVNLANYDTTINGKKVQVFFASNGKGAEMAVTNFGGRIISLVVPDKDGKPTDVVLGCDYLRDYYSANTKFYGAIIGRYGNRIAKGSFVIDKDTFKLAQNNNGQALHGGPEGFHNQMWDVVQPAKNKLELSLVSPDGQEGYPGKLTAKVTYTLTENNELKIEYSATTDKATVVNLTNHSYFNLNGEGGGTINNLILSINADNYMPVDSVLIPTSISSVDGTPFDFRKPTAIGDRVNDTTSQQIKFGKGYDHNFVLNRSEKGVIPVASLYSPITGITMDILTDQPGLQFYGGNFMGNDPGKGGKKYNFREGLCVETQKYPNSPNQPSYPSTLLKPGETYTHTCIYKFGVK